LKLANSNEKEKAKILLTTSRRPTNRLRTFCRDITHSIPNIVRINRGKLSLETLVEKAIELNADRVIIVDRWKGGPGKIELFYVRERLIGTPPLIYLKGVKLRREFREKAKKVQACAITVLDNEDRELQKFSDILSKFLQLPKNSIHNLNKVHIEKPKTILCVSRDREMKIQLTFRLLPRLIEVGPRVRLSHLVWEVNRK